MFLKEKDYLYNKLKKLKRFNSGQEKDSLLSEDKKASDIVKILAPDAEPLNELEALAFLIELRKISVSDVIDLVTTCSSCKTPNNFLVNTDEYLDLTSHYTFKGHIVPIGLFMNTEEIINITELDKLTIPEYQELENIIDEQNSRILCDAVRKCRSCSQELKLPFDFRTGYTKSSLAGIYKEYIDLSSNSANSFADIDKIYPFERTIFLSLIQEKLDKLAQES